MTTETTEDTEATEATEATAPGISTTTDKQGENVLATESDENTANPYGLQPLTMDEAYQLVKDMAGKHAADQAQDILDKGQRVIRTVLQVLIGFILAAPTITAMIEALGIDPATNIGGFLAAVGAGVTVVAGALSRVFSIPAVNQWLTKLGAGSVPKSAA